MNQVWSSRMMEQYSDLNQKDTPIPAATWMDLEGITLSEVNQSQKDKYDSTYTSCLNQSNSQEKETEQQLPWAGGERAEESLFNGHKISVRVEKVLEMDAVDSFTTM